MSLFGGEISDLQTSQAEDEFFSAASQGYTASGKPPSTTTPIPSSLQKAHQVSYLAFDADDEGSFEDESERELDPDKETSRPNRFAGKASTWKRYTAAERQLAASLDEIQARDLAAHLYNAHALKRRVRKPAEALVHAREWQSKDSWLKKVEDLQSIDMMGDVQTELIPQKLWTAWPLPVKKAPASDTRFGLRGSDRVAYGAIGGFGDRYASEELREEMLALFLRLAKEKWRSRNTENKWQDGKPETQRKAGSKVKREIFHLAVTDAEQDEADVEMQHDDGIDAGSDAAQQSGTDTKSMPTLTLDTSKSVHPSQPLARPTFLADDDKARRILQPSINSLLTQLNDTAAAIRRSRLNRFGRGVHTDTSGSEMLSDADRLQSGSRSRSQRQSSSASTRKPTSRALSGASSKSRKRRGGETKSEAPENRQDADESESASDYGADAGLNMESSSDSSRASRTRRKRGRSSGTDLEDDILPMTGRDDAYKRTGLMDWGEVLGIASLTGFGEQAVARTAQRCATLFGEGMSFRLFSESIATKTIPEPVQYTPTTILSPDLFSVQGINATPKRPHFEPKTLHCPHTDCWGHEKTFPIAYRVIEHVIRVHRYDPRLNTSDDDETYGCVHRDGFLQPITAKQGWLGQRRKKSVGGGGGDSDGGTLQQKPTKRRQTSGPSSPVSALDSLDRNADQMHEEDWRNNTSQ